MQVAPDPQGLDQIVAAGVRVAEHRPWPRVIVDVQGWERAIGLLHHARCTLLGMWGDGQYVHLALMDPTRNGFAVLSHACIGGRFPSVGRLHAPAARLERAIRDLWGLESVGALDARAWLNHGRWPVGPPAGPAQPDPHASAPYPFLAAEGESLHQIPVGPVHAGIIEPGHFRFTASGETVVRLEQRLGYVHKGIESLMVGLPVERAAALAGRVSGDSTVAYALAFARAVEAALGLDVPPRALWLRALMAELERLANHLGDIGAICNDAAFAMLHAQFGLLRERVLRAAQHCFGHRLMMDRIVPGGVAGDLPQDGPAAIVQLAALIRGQLPELIELYDNTASLQDRTVGTGFLPAALAVAFGAGGYVGRASGRAFDARRTPGYPPYDALRFDVPVLEEGDVDARVRIRLAELETSLAIIGQILQGLPSGPVTHDRNPTSRSAEGTALVEGFRGDVLIWVRLGDEGWVERCHLRDPSWFQWPLLEAAIEGNIVADFPLCNKSFNCSYSGHDL
jgi:Ni,Fe-hydrogenase III large subunit